MKTVIGKIVFGVIILGFLAFAWAMHSIAIAGWTLVVFFLGMDSLLTQY